MWVRLARRACSFAFCKMRLDAIGHPGILGLALCILHPTCREVGFSFLAYWIVKWYGYWNAAPVYLVIVFPCLSWQVICIRVPPLNNCLCTSSHFFAFGFSPACSLLAAFLFAGFSFMSLKLSLCYSNLPAPCLGPPELNSTVEGGSAIIFPSSLNIVTSIDCYFFLDDF